MQGSAATSASPPNPPRLAEPLADGNDTDQRTTGWDDLLLILGSSFYLCINLFTFRGTPFLLSGDQVFYWMDAQRMIAGDRIYRDFFKFTPPGTDLLYFGAFQFLGLRIWVPNLVVLLLGIVLTWLCFRIAILFLNRSHALLAASFFLVLIYGTLLNATHHWFSEMAVLAAVAVMMRGRGGTRIAVAGVLLGVASFFTQTRGPAAFAGMATFLLWEQKSAQLPLSVYFKRLALLCTSSLAAWTALSGYFIATTGLRQLLYWQVIYSLHYKVSGANALGLPGGPFDWHKWRSYGLPLFVYVMLPVTYSFSLLACWNERKGPPIVTTERRMILTLTGLATALEVIMSPNWLRVYCVAAPGILLLVWIMSKFKRMQRLAAAMMWLALICLAFRQAWSRHHEQSELVNLAAGSAAMTHLAAEKLEWIGRHTKPGDYFFQPAWPAVYLPLRLNTPIYAEGFGSTDDTRPEYVADGIRQLEIKKVQYILWTPRLNFPGDSARPEAYHLVPFRDYMKAHYRRVWIFSDLDEVWERM